MAASTSSAAAGASAAGTASTSGAASASILVGLRQKKNPVLDLVENVPWKFVDMAPDFILGESTCALYLSMRYHLLHPDYLYSRISELKRDFKLRLVFCVVDIQNCQTPLMMLTSLASANEFTVILCWSQQECARYLETFKLYERKAPKAIQERVESGYMPKLEDALTVIRSVNRTDVKVLSTNFGSLRNIMSASMEEMSLCQGIGDKKLRRLYATFNEPFL
ncbi:DNA excision repair protein ERCC-1 [Hondaea fermentalgiana]|uniref:DNA excision repair protein ERCC-1 n=1 Tax=Hondaea fermentalgiana TaxID=2315210 RepID=A0A2R5FZ74_9STRA|nr:DNA excision repair protein ERCC-1 [Hondaea fermentalgiana]|eukprot:GBG24030.1 DNA excision repair protein ERCC-1 [Hondaea fermentalgiana]